MNAASAVPQPLLLRWWFSAFLRIFRIVLRVFLLFTLPTFLISYTHLLAFAYFLIYFLQKINILWRMLCKCATYICTCTGVYAYNMYVYIDACNCMCFWSYEKCHWQVFPVFGNFFDFLACGIHTVTQLYVCDCFKILTHLQARNAQF